jgi:hypothetical protein
MTPEELNFFLGITSIVVAIGMSLFMIIRDTKRREKEEKFYSEEIKENLKAIMQYFITVSTKSENYQEFDNEENEITLSLNDFYERHHQEMTDLLYLTKLYLTQWRTLDENKKKLVKDILERFSWLSYEYYPLHLPNSIKKTRWLKEGKELDEKRSFVSNNIPIILNENL